MAEKMSSEDNRKGLERLIQALQAKPDDEACRTCLSQLGDYISAQLAGEDYTGRFPDVALHLDSCPDCAGAYARLYELELADITDQLPLPDQLSVPELNFLSPNVTSSTSSQARLAEQVRNAIHRTGESLTLRLSADLLSILRPSPMSGATRVPSDRERYSQVILSLEAAQIPDLDWPIALTAYQDALEPNLCLVEIVVEPAGQSWPDLGGRMVVLTLAGEEHEAVTDAWGIVSFEGVPVDGLVDASVVVTLTD